jgi:iron complex transport system ATP-binding protein
VPNDPPLIEYRNVTVNRGQRIALERVSLSIGRGENVAILGPNGSGKSTLIKTITRECYPRLSPDSSLRILGRDTWNIFELRSLLGIVSSDLVSACLGPYTAREIVLSGFFSSIGLWPHHRVQPSMEAKAAEAMELLEVAHLAERAMTEVSPGEARRVVIARALVHEPMALVLDEPTASLDLHATYELRRILRRVAAAGTGIVMVTHHLDDIIPEIGRVILLKEGRVFADGPKDEILTVERLEGLFGTRFELVRRDGYYHLW